MQRSSSHAFINQLLVYTLVMFFFTGSIGFGTVWLRHEISLAANRHKNLQSRVSEVERRLAQVGSEIAAELNPDALIRRNSEWRLGLVVPVQEQVEHIAGAVEPRLAQKRYREVFAPELQPVVFRLPDGSGR